MIPFTCYNDTWQVLMSVGGELHFIPLCWATRHCQSVSTTNWLAFYHSIPSQLPFYSVSTTDPCDHFKCEYTPFNCPVDSTLQLSTVSLMDATLAVQFQIAPPHHPSGLLVIGTLTLRCLIIFTMILHIRRKFVIDSQFYITEIRERWDFLGTSMESY